MGFMVLIKCMFILWGVFSVFYFREDIIGLFKNKKQEQAPMQDVGKIEEGDFIGGANAVYYNEDFDYHNPWSEDVEVVLEDISEQLQERMRNLEEWEYREPENDQAEEECAPETAGTTYEELVDFIEEAENPSDDPVKREQVAFTYQRIQSMQMCVDMRKNPRLLANLEELAKITVE